jgi:hypothetical protein
MKNVRDVYMYGGISVLVASVEAVLLVSVPVWVLGLNGLRGCAL